MEEITFQAHKIAEKYFECATIEEISEEIIIRGIFRLNDEYENVVMKGGYEIEIMIPHNYPKALPIVKEIGGKIPTSYSHMYRDRSLCLATEGDMKINLLPDYSLDKFMKDYVVSFFYRLSAFICSISKKFCAAIER